MAERESSMRNMKKDVVAGFVGSDYRSEEQKAADLEAFELKQKVFSQYGELTGSVFVAKLNANLDDLEKNYSKVINKYLKDNSKLQTGGMTSSTMPGLDNRQVIANTKAVKNHFEKKILNPNFKIFYNGQKQSDGTGTAAQLVEDLEWDETAVTVTQVTFDTTPYL